MYKLSIYLSIYLSTRLFLPSFLPSCLLSLTHPILHSSFCPSFLLPLFIRLFLSLSILLTPIITSEKLNNFPDNKSLCSHHYTFLTCSPQVLQTLHTHAHTHILSFFYLLYYRLATFFLCIVIKFYTVRYHVSVNSVTLFN